MEPHSRPSEAPHLEQFVLAVIGPLSRRPPGLLRRYAGRGRRSTRDRRELPLKQDSAAAQAPWRFH